MSFKERLGHLGLQAGKLAYLQAERVYHHIGPELARNDTAFAKGFRFLSGDLGKDENGFSLYLNSPQKKIFDTAAAAVISVAAAPVILGLAYANWRVNGRRPFFFQERMGPGEGNSHWIAKFETMVPGSDSKASYLQNAHGRSEKQDPRITTFGNLLRDYHLDELPQIIHVLTGKLKLVGVRSATEFSVDIAREGWTDEEHDRWRKAYHTAGPAATGFDQVFNPNHKTDTTRLWYDLYYAENADLPMDGRILVETVRTMARIGKVALFPPGTNGNGRNGHKPEITLAEDLPDKIEAST